MKRLLILFFIFLISVSIVSAAEIHPRVKEYFNAGISNVDVIIVYEDKEKFGFLGNDFNIKYHNEKLKYASGELSRKGYQKIIENDIVEKVEYDIPIQSLLDNSVLQINADNAHSSVFNGINITGLNVGVCVVDSGVNYSISSLGGCLGNGCKVVGGYDLVNGDSDPMDDFGHGTPVTSVVASNHSTYKGAASDVGIFHVKALNQFGGGSLSDTQKAIEMCTGNSTNFNISVVSLSFGTDYPFMYDSYCDSLFSSYASVINDAAANNITVVISSGNDNNKTHISMPACIENATAVGAVNSNDNVAAFSNMNNLVDFVMPGVSLKIPGISGRIVTKSGTSFSVPHLSGVIALLQSYKKMERGFGFDNNDLSNILITTAVNVSENANIYPRANAFDALKKADELKPNLVLTKPENKTYSFGVNVPVEFTVSDMMLEKCWYTLNGTTEVSCNNFNLSLSEGSFEFTLYANDSNGNKNSAVISFAVMQGFGADIIKPVNGSVFNKGSLDFEYGTYGVVNSCYYNLDNGNNASLPSCGNTSLSILDGVHNLNLFVNNTFGVVNFTNSVFEVDTVAPDLTLVSPVNNDIFAGSVLVDVNTNGKNCYYNLNNGNNLSIDNCDTVTITPDIGNHNITVYANDTAGNINFSPAGFGFGPELPSVSLIGLLKTNQSQTDLLCDVTAENITKTELFHDIGQNFSSSQIKYYNGVKSSFNFTVTGLSTGNYLWNCLATDRDNEARFALLNNSLGVDLEQPVISLLSPNASITLSSGSGILFKYNVTDENNIEKCELFVDDNPEKQDTSVVRGAEESLQADLGSGNRQWYVKCKDEYGNFKDSEKRNMTIQAAASTSSGGSTSAPAAGGGGGGGGGGEPSVRKSSEESTPGSEGSVKVSKESTSEAETGNAITGSAVKGVEKLAEEKSWLKKGLEFLYGNDANIVGFAVKESKLVNDVKVERKLEGTDTITWKITYNGKESVDNVIVYDEVPKSFADDADKINIESDFDTEVVEKDPVFLFNIGEFEAKEVYNFIYKLKEGSVTEDVLKEFKDPVILSTPDKPVSKWWKYWWIFVLFVIILSFWFAIGILMGHDYDNRGVFERVKEKVYSIIDKMFRRY